MYTTDDISQIFPDLMQIIVAAHSHEDVKVQRWIESIIFHHTDFVHFDFARFLGAQAAKTQ